MRLLLLYRSLNNIKMSEPPPIQVSGRRSVISIHNAHACANINKSGSTAGLRGKQQPGARCDTDRRRVADQKHKLCTILMPREQSYTKRGAHSLVRVACLSSTECRRHLNMSVRMHVLQSPTSMTSNGLIVARRFHLKMCAFVHTIGVIVQDWQDNLNCSCRRIIPN